jgi:hypothetical protein
MITLSPIGCAVSSFMDRRESHVAAGLSGRLGLEDMPLTISLKLKILLSSCNVDVGF